MLTKKSIVLCGINDDRKKAVLTMEYNGGNLSGRVRLYNFSTEPLGILSLGLTSENGVIKAGLTREESMLFSFGAPTKSFPENFSCAIVNFVGGEPSPILYGSVQGAGNLEQTLSEVVGQLKNTNSMKEVEKTLDDFGVEYDDELKKEIDKEIEKNFSTTLTQKDQPCNKNCDDCIYKKYFYENHEVEKLSSNQISSLPQEDEKEEKQEQTFFSEIKNQVDTLFSQNKPEEYLEGIIPNSKWVKVDFDDGGDFYVFGLIYEEDSLKYVCYGVPGMYSPNPPKQLSGFPVWFPLDKEKKEGFGYWLSYQDANTGESVKAIVD